MSLSADHPALRPSHHRHSHPQRLTTGQSAGKRKRVERDVEVGVLFEQVSMKARAAQLNSFGRNASPDKFIRDLPAENFVIKCTPFQNEVSAGYCGQHSRPHVKHLCVEL